MARRRVSHYLYRGTEQPQIQLRGRWLRDLGYEPGLCFDVETSRGTLEIRPSTNKQRHGSTELIASQHPDSQNSEAGRAPNRMRRAASAEQHDFTQKTTDGGLLTLLLHPQDRPAYARLINDYASLRRLGDLHPAELAAHGLSREGINRISAVFELARRYSESEWPIGEPFRSSYDVYAHYRERLASERVEYFYTILLDNKHRKMKDVVVSQGSLTSSIVHPRDVYGPVVRDSAAAVIFVHNHPSGDPTPSREDLEITRRLRDVGELVGVRVLDHLVIGKGRYVSFVDDGYW